MPEVNAWAILVPAVVTPTVVAGYAYYQQRQERRHKDLQELRDVIDQAARSLADAMEAALTYRGQWTPTTWPSEDAADAMTQALHAVRYSTDRLTIRIGAAVPVTRLHRAAGEAVGAYALGMIAEADAKRPYPDDQVRAWRDAAQRARNGFLEAAVAMVGLAIPGGPSPLYPALPLPPGRDR